MSNGTSAKTQHLDALAAVLEAQGLAAVRRYDTTPARLVVENRDLCAGDEPVMSECITVRPQETTAVFCWRAGDPIGRVDDIEAAALKIVSVLTLAELAEGPTVAPTHP